MKLANDQDCVGKTGKNQQKLQYTKVHRNTENGLIIAHQQLTVMTKNWLCHSDKTWKVSVLTLNYCVINCIVNFLPKKNKHLSSNEI